MRTVFYVPNRKVENCAECPEKIVDGPLYIQTVVTAAAELVLPVARGAHPDTEDEDGAKAPRAVSRS